MRERRPPTKASSSLRRRRRTASGSCWPRVQPTRARGARSRSLRIVQSAPRKSGSQFLALMVTPADVGPGRASDNRHSVNPLPERSGANPTPRCGGPDSLTFSAPLQSIPAPRSAPTFAQGRADMQDRRRKRAGGACSCSPCRAIGRRSGRRPDVRPDDGNRIASSSAFGFQSFIFKTSSHRRRQVKFNQLLTAKSGVQPNAAIRINLARRRMPDGVA